MIWQKFLRKKVYCISRDRDRDRKIVNWIQWIDSSQPNSPIRPDTLTSLNVSLFPNTVCQRSLDPFYTVSYYIIVCLKLFFSVFATVDFIVLRIGPIGQLLLNHFVPIRNTIKSTVAATGTEKTLKVTVSEMETVPWTRH